MTFRRAGLLLNLAAGVCLVVALSVRDRATIEGAYFNRAVGGDDSVVAITNDASPAWVITALVLLVVGTGLLVAPREADR